MNPFRFLFCGLLAVVLLSGLPTHAASQKDMQEQLEKLESKVNKLELTSNPGNPVSAFISERISFGGFFEHSISSVFSAAHTTKVAADSNIMGINIGAKLNEKFRFVSQSLFVLSFPLTNKHDNTLRAFSNTPALGALVAHAYGEYSANDKFRLQMGIGWVPFGIVLANREFPTLIKHGGPMLSSGGLTMPFGVWNGLHALGEFSLDWGTLGYNLYSITPTTDANMMGGGTRLWWASNGNHVRLGASSQILDRSTDTVFNLGTDLELKFGLVGLRTEYVQSIADGEDIRTVYFEPYVELAEGKFVIHGDVDYAKRPLHFSDAATFVPFEKWELGGGVNWLPWRFVRARLLFLYHNYVGASAATGGNSNDFYSVEYSTGIEF